MSLVDALFLDPYPFEYWLARRTDQMFGSGTLNDPWDASTPERFDVIMNELGALGGPVRVHLGPGVFFTAGYTDGDPSAGWQIKSNMIISGAGVDATTLQIVNSTASAHQFFAVGHALRAGNPEGFNPAHFAEISDLTIDCNLAALPGGSAAGAIRLMGDHVRAQNVKAINWGTKDSGKSCRVISGITALAAVANESVERAEYTNAVIERCIAVRPSITSAGPVTVFHIGSKDDAGPVAEACGLGPVIRNCFVDATPYDETFPQNPLNQEVRALSMNSCRGGIVEGNQVHNTRYGGPFERTTTTRGVIVRLNVYKNVLRGPFWDLGLIKAPSALTSLVRDSQNPKIAKATTKTSAADRGFQVGDRVQIGGTAPAEFKGVFTVATAPKANEFTYEMTTAPTSDATAATARKVFETESILVERNIIELAAEMDGAFIGPWPARRTRWNCPELAAEFDDWENAPVGFSLSDHHFAEETGGYTHEQVIARHNYVQYFNNQYEAAFQGYGAAVQGAENAIIRDNMLQCAPANPLRDFRCGHATYLNNRLPSGALIQGYDGVNHNKRSELETEAEDALLMTLF